MKKLRQLHLYLGCLFAPLILYYSLSGAWQVFRFNDLPKNTEPTGVQVLLHELSNPHTHSTLPGLNPKTEHSAAFNGIALAMAIGLILTTFIGLMLALQYTKSRRMVLFCIASGIILPTVLLLFR